MEDWLDYRLSDLLLFSPRTYYRLIELYNRDLWPAHVAAVGTGMWGFAALARGSPRSMTSVTAVVAAVWVWVAWAFHLRRYATINWGARYFAILFVAQAAALIWLAMRHRRRPQPVRGDWLTLALFGFALVAFPFIGPIVGRGWTTVEVYGAAPDPTAIATLAIVAAFGRGARWYLVLPATWCAISGATLWVMDQPDAFVAPACGVIGVIAAFRSRREQAGSTGG